MKCYSLFPLSNAHNKLITITAVNAAANPFAYNSAPPSKLLKVKTSGKCTIPDNIPTTTPFSPDNGANAVEKIIARDIVMFDA